MQILVIFILIVLVFQLAMPSIFAFLIVSSCLVATFTDMLNETEILCKPLLASKKIDKITLWLVRTFD